MVVWRLDILCAPFPAKLNYCIKRGVVLVLLDERITHDQQFGSRIGINCRLGFDRLCNLQGDIANTLCTLCSFFLVIYLGFISSLSFIIYPLDDSILWHQKLVVYFFPTGRQVVNSMVIKSRPLLPNHKYFNLFCHQQSSDAIILSSLAG